MKKNPGGNFGNDFFRKGDWGLPQKYKKRHLLKMTFFIKFVFVRTNTMLAKEKREDC